MRKQGIWAPRKDRRAGAVLQGPVNCHWGRPVGQDWAGGSPGQSL